MTDDRTVIFLHIGKTAGTTLRQVMRRQFPAAAVMTVRARRRPREETLTDFARLPSAERLRPRLIMGHTVYGLHESIERPSTYVTMLRDPVRLVHSQYRYVLRTPGHRHHEAAQGMSFAAYVESGIALEMDNSQTRAIAGAVGVPFGACDEDVFDRARRHLDEHFAWVGLTEMFDESLLMLGRTFGWPDVRYVSRNVARSSRPMPADDRALAERMNAFDRRLYDHARDRLAERIAAVPEFAEELVRFRRANDRYRIWGRLSYTWPSAVRRRLAPVVPRGG